MQIKCVCVCCHCSCELRYRPSRSWTAEPNTLAGPRSRAPRAATPPAARARSLCKQFTHVRGAPVHTSRSCGRATIVPRGRRRFSPIQREQHRAPCAPATGMLWKAGRRTRMPRVHCIAVVFLWSPRALQAEMGPLLLAQRQPHARLAQLWAGTIVPRGRKFSPSQREQQSSMLWQAGAHARRVCAALRLCFCGPPGHCRPEWGSCAIAVGPVFRSICGQPAIETTRAV